MADGEHVDAVGAQVAHDLKDFLVGFAKADHQSRFCRYVRVLFLEFPEKCQRVGVIGSGACLFVEARHGFQIVVEDIRQGLAEDVDGDFHAPPEVGDECFYRRLRRFFAHSGDHIDEVLGAAIAQVVAIDTGDDDIAQFEVSDTAGKVDRFVGVRRKWFAMTHIAEGAAPGTDIAEDHEGGRAPSEAFTDVGASGFLADGVQFLFAQQALDFTASQNVLLTIGIKPSRPDTGYGYIQVMNDTTIDLPCPELKKVKTFTEKPELPMAKIFFESGEFFWNSGMFFWSLSSIMQAFDTHMPNINNLFQKQIDQLGTDNESAAVADIYAQCKNISIDYAIMEKSDNVYVLCADFGWSDIGTWGSLYANQRRDKSQNAVVGNNVFLYDTKGCEINIHPQKLAVIQGLEDMIVVQTDDVLLICKKDDEQRIKDFVNKVKLEKGEDYI